MQNIFNDLEYIASEFIYVCEAMGLFFMASALRSLLLTHVL